jgi:hypothetical protein
MTQAGRSEGRPLIESARAGGRCGTCGSSNVMTVGMLFEQDPVTVQVCSDCESRTWTRSGRPVDVGELVQAFRRTGRRRNG